MLAADLGGTTLAAGLVRPSGDILAQRLAPTDRCGRGEGVLQNLLGVMSELCSALSKASGIRGAAALFGYEQGDRP